MGRGMLNLDLIQDMKTRQRIFKKRKPDILKKAKELSILCGIPVLVVIYDQDSSSRNHPFVQCHGPKRTIQKEKEWCPEDIISKYDEVIPESREKNKYTVSHFLKDRNFRAEIYLERMRRESWNVKYPIDWVGMMDVFSVEKLRDVVRYLDDKIKIVREKIDLLKRKRWAESNVQSLLLAGAHDDALHVPELSTKTTAGSLALDQQHQQNQCSYNYVSNGNEGIGMFNPLPVSVAAAPSMLVPMPVQYYYSVQPQHYQNNYGYAGQWKTLMMLMDGSPSNVSGLTSNSSSLNKNIVNNLVNFGHNMEPGVRKNVWMLAGFGGVENVVLPCPKPLTSWQPPSGNPTAQQPQNDNFTPQTQAWRASSLDSTVNFGLDSLN